MVKSSVVQFHTTGISLIKGPLTRALKKWIHRRNSGSLMCGEQYCEGRTRTSITLSTKRIQKRQIGNVYFPFKYVSEI